MEDEIYLHDIPLEEAQRRLEAALENAGLHGRLGSEEIPLDENACGRVLAAAVWARISSPHYHASAMDGFAVRSASTEGAGPVDPVTLQAGERADAPDAAYVDTGDLLPEWADAVIPIENVEPLDGNEAPARIPRQPAQIRIRAAVSPWSHVRPLGEDMVATQLVLPEGHVLRPVDLGAVAASGHSSIVVSTRPRVAVLPTGSELVPIGERAGAGEIIEFNSMVLAAQMREWGANATRMSITPDNMDALLKQTAEACRTHDLVLINAGSSAGSEDYTASVVRSLGRLLVHGVAVRPGHPVIIGIIEMEPGRQVPIIGVPGYPVSAALTGEVFIEPLLARWLGRKPHHPVTVTARLTRKVTSPAGDADYMRVAVGRVGEDLLAAPLSRGSGVISSLVRADGITIIPPGSQGLPAGSEVQVRLYRDLHELEQTIFAIGSHDVILDLMSQFLARKNRRLASANVGSLGGLVALRRGEAHLAGAHLLDTETGEYNLSYVRRYMPGIAVNIVALVERQQGLMVLPKNPKDIHSLADLTREDVSFVNRQRGAGTRVLLDYHLAKLNVPPEQVEGYNREEYTHLAVAVAVASGRADVALGIAAAAQALGLDFIPLFSEQYDLIIPRLHYHSPLLAPLLELLHTEEFKKAVVALPGYNVEEMGDLRAEIEGGERDVYSPGDR